MSDWGKGSENNNIGWGQAAGSATNDWGKSQKNSYAGQTDIVGLIALSISYSANNYCDDSGNTPAPTVSNNTGSGTFASTAGLVIDFSTGVINTNTSTAGSYVITYTDTDAATATATVVILNLDNAAFSYSASSFEPTDADPTPTITGLTGGTFSGTTGLVIDSSTGVIDLSASTVASHTITYDTTSSGSSVCPNTSTQNVDIALAGIANNHSFSFDGINDYILTGFNPTTIGTGDYTVSLWFNATTGATEDYPYIYALGTASNYQGFSLSNRSGNTYKLRINNNSGGSYSQDVSATLNISAGTWYHIVITRSGNTINLYLDGNTTPYLSLNSSEVGSNTINNTEFKIGFGDQAAATRFFGGNLDEVGIWNTALTTTQVQSIYNATSTGKTADLSTISGSNLKYWNRLGD